MECDVLPYVIVSAVVGDVFLPAESVGDEVAELRVGEVLVDEGLHTEQLGHLRAVGDVSTHQEGDGPQGVGTHPLRQTRTFVFTI